MGFFSFLNYWVRNLDWRNSNNNKVSRVLSWFQSEMSPTGSCFDCSVPNLWHYCVREWSLQERYPATRFGPLNALVFAFHALLHEQPFTFMALYFPHYDELKVLWNQEPKQPSSIRYFVTVEGKYKQDRSWFQYHKLVNYEQQQFLSHGCKVLSPKHRSHHGQMPSGWGPQ